MRHPTGLHPDPAVLATSDGTRTVLLNTRRGTYFSLDEVGGSIWKLLQVGSTVPEIVRTLRGKYDVSDAVLVQDVERLLDEMAAEGLITLQAR